MAYTIMHSWHGAFTSNSRSDDDSVIVAGEARFSTKSSVFSSRRSRHLNRAKKVRPALKNDVDLWRSPALSLKSFQEIKVLSHLKHPNIVQYYGSKIVSNILGEALW